MWTVWRGLSAPCQLSWSRDTDHADLLAHNTNFSPRPVLIPDTTDTHQPPPPTWDRLSVDTGLSHGSHLPTNNYENTFQALFWCPQQPAVLLVSIWTRSPDASPQVTVQQLTSTPPSLQLQPWPSRDQTQLPSH